MNVKIWDDKYLIKSDARQYTLIEVKEKASDKETINDIVSEDNGTYEVVVGYYGSLAHLFEGLAAREGRLNKCTTLEGYVKHIEKVNKKLEENLLAMAAVVGKKEAFKRVLDAMPDEIPENIAKLGEEKKEKKKNKRK